MFKWIEDFSKKVAKNRLEKKLIELSEVAEKYNFPKEDYINISGFKMYYKDINFLAITKNNITESLLKKVNNKIYLTGEINEKIDYTKMIDNIIDCIKNSDVINKVKQ